MDKIFVWIPKTGGASLWKMISGGHDIHLTPRNGIKTYGHVDVCGLSGFKFCFVRNPYDRALSLYAYLSRLGKLQGSFLDFCRGLQDIEPIGGYNVKGLSQCNPQVCWMQDINFIGRFENYEEDVHRLFHILGLPAPEILHINRSPNKPEYCPESKEIVTKFYQEDFKQLGYESGLCSI